MLRIPHCLDNRLIDGGKAVSLTKFKNLTMLKVPLFLAYTYNTLYFWCYLTINKVYFKFHFMKTLNAILILYAYS
jgi:hypothetical protein